MHSAQRGKGIGLTKAFCWPARATTVLLEECCWACMMMPLPTRCSQVLPSKPEG